MISHQLTTKKQYKSDSFKWLSKIFNLFKRPAQQPVRRKVDAITIKNRMSHLGWSLKEIPIRKSSIIPEERVVINWRVIAFNKDRSFEVTDKSLDDAIKKIGVYLGVVNESNL